MNIARARDPRRRRSLVLLVAVGAVGLVFAALSITFGVRLIETIRAIVGDGDPYVEFVVETLRLPRLASAAITGTALGLAGAIFQGVTRNDLASPDILGVTAGASLAALIAVVWLDARSFEVSLAAFAGAMTSVTAIYMLAYRQGADAYRLVLVGIGIGAFLAAVTSYLLTRARISDTQGAFVWLVGSLNEQTWALTRTAGIAVLALLPLVWLLSRSLRLLQLGDEQARGLGVPVQRSRASLVLVGAALAATATATVGPVGFVALLAPNIARIALRRASAPLIAAGLIGCTLMIAADFAAMRVLPSMMLPVGVVTPVIGAPYLLWLLHRADRVERAHA